MDRPPNQFANPEDDTPQYWLADVLSQARQQVVLDEEPQRKKLHRRKKGNLYMELYRRQVNDEKQLVWASDQITPLVIAGTLFVIVVVALIIFLVLLLALGQTLR